MHYDSITVNKEQWSDKSSVSKVSISMMTPPVVMFKATAISALQYQSWFSTSHQDRIYYPTNHQHNVISQEELQLHPKTNSEKSITECTLLFTDTHPSVTVWHANWRNCLKSSSTIYKSCSGNKYRGIYQHLSQNLKLKVLIVGSHRLTIRVCCPSRAK